MNRSHPVDSEYARQLADSQRQLYAYIVSLFVHPETAMEILQETNTVLLEKADQFEPGTNFMGWARRIAHFEVLAARKRAGLSRARMLDNEVIERLACEAAERDDDLTHKVAALLTCLRRLTDRQRQVIEARYKQNLTVKDIAEHLGLKPNTTAQILHRSRVDLLDCIRRRLDEKGQPS